MYRYRVKRDCMKVIGAGNAVGKGAGASLAAAAASGSRTPLAFAAAVIIIMIIMASFVRFLQSLPSSFSPFAKDDDSRSTTTAKRA